MGNSSSHKAQQEKRIQRCLVSFQQLQADIRHINMHCAIEFAHHANLPPRPNEPNKLQPEAEQQQPQHDEEYVLQFRPFTKLSKKSSLPWLWKVNDNVIVVATIVTKREAEAALRNAVPAAVPATAAAAASSSGSAAAAVAPSNLLPPHSRSHTLTLVQFYTLFIHYVDSVKLVTTLRDQVLKIEQPAMWQARQDARRNELMQQRAKRHSVGGHEENLTLTASAAAAAAAARASNEEKDEHKAASSSSLAPSSLSRNSSTDSSGGGKPISGVLIQECCICLTAPDEDAKGEELVVLSCLHAFCSSCIAEWREHSPTCPLCRRDLEAGEEDADESWILTSPDLAELRRSLQRLLDFPFDFLRNKPAFPPRDNSRGVKSAGDAFSLVVGEVIDVVQQVTTKPAAAAPAPAPAPAADKSVLGASPPPSQQQQQQQSRQSDAAAVATTTSDGASSPRPSANQPSTRGSPSPNATNHQQTIN